MKNNYQTKRIGQLSIGGGQGMRLYSVDAKSCTLDTTKGNFYAIPFNKEEEYGRDNESSGSNETRIL